MAFRNEYTLNVDIKKRMANIVPIFLKGDTAKLNFRIYDNGILYDLSDYTRSEITFELPSGQTYVNACTLVNGLVEYSFIGVEMAEIGDVITTVTIYSGIDRVSIQPFTVHIIDNMRGDDLSYISILQDLIKQVQDLELEVLPLVNEVNSLIDNVNDLIDQVDQGEDVRNQNEQQRINAENSRISNEESRYDAEQERLLAEGTRLINEANRINAENLRVIAEQARESAELLRAQNSQARFDNFDFIIANLDYKGEYDPEVQYQHYNVVFYQGSSFVAQRAVIGIPPNDDDVDWSMLARKGLDGQGAVQSVNGLLPDSNGNITVPGVDVVDNLISHDTTKALSANKGRELKSLVDGKILKSSNEPISQISNDVWFDVSDMAIQSIDIENGELSVTPPIDVSKLWLMDNGNGNITIKKNVLGTWIQLNPETNLDQVIDPITNKSIKQLLNEHVTNQTNEKHVNFLDHLPANSTGYGLMLKDEGLIPTPPEKPNYDNLNLRVSNLEFNFGQHTSTDTADAHLAKNIQLEDNDELFQSTTVEGGMKELFTYVSNGKDTIASAITDKGGSATGEDSFDALAQAISDIPTSTYEPVTGIVTSGDANNIVKYANGSNKPNTALVTMNVELPFEPSFIFIKGITGTNNLTTFAEKSPDSSMLTGTAKMMYTNTNTLGSQNTYNFDLHAQPLYMSQDGFCLPVLEANKAYRFTVYP